MKQGRLFGFTHQEEAKMRLAMKAALAYMNVYGSGRKPSYIGVDLTHYEQNLGVALPKPPVVNGQGTCSKCTPTASQRRR